MSKVKSRVRAPHRGHSFVSGRGTYIDDMNANGQLVGDCPLAPCARR